MVLHDFNEFLMIFLNLVNFMCFCSVFLVVMLVLLGVNFGVFCLFFWGLLQFWWLGMYGIVFVRFIFFLIYWCGVGGCVLDFFVLDFVLFWCFSAVCRFFCSLLVLLAQAVRFIAMFCFVVIFVFYGGMIKCLIFLFAIGTVSINDLYFCNFFVIFTIIFTIFLLFIIKKHQIFLVQIYFTVYFILMCCIPSSSKGLEFVTNPNFS